MKQPPETPLGCPKSSCTKSDIGNALILTVPLLGFVLLLGFAAKIVHLAISEWHASRRAYAPMSSSDRPSSVSSDPASDGAPSHGRRVADSAMRRASAAETESLLPCPATDGTPAQQTYGGTVQGGRNKYL